MVRCAYGGYVAKEYTCHRNITRMSALYKFLILPLPAIVSIFHIERIDCVLGVFLARKGIKMIESHVDAYGIAHSRVAQLQQSNASFNGE